ncbi:MAG TPA: polysaccharide deacetylase family protein [Solirubrobacterales bacterium]|nr:polysaccharide deacetylase family protein [Solirubrobacterales bacterium]
MAIVALALPMFELVAAAPGAAAPRVGGPGSDSLIGTARADTLRGLGGDDTLFGKAGADQLVGGTGADKLMGGPGADWQLGGSGDDRLLAKDGSVDTVNCGSGTGDVAIVDPVDRVAASCERVEGPPADQPPAPLPPTSSSAAPSTPPADPPPGEEPPEEEPPLEEPEVEYEEQPLAMFPEGHGWTGNGVGEFADAGGPFAVNGDRSYRITSNGTGAASIASSPALDPVDFRSSHVSVHGQVSFSNRLRAVKLRLASGDIATDYAEATIWQEDLDPVILGSTFEFQSLPIGAFDVVGNVDWSQIDRAQVIVTDNETGSVFFYVAGIYAVPTERKATISFAFDDGYESVFTRGLKKLSTYRYPASTYVIADTVGTANILDLEQLYKLRDQHQWEIGGHSLTIASHNLPDGLDDLEPAALKAEMDGLRDWIYEHGFSRLSFAYPKGAAGESVRKFVARDYCSGRVTARGPETLPPRDHYTMRGWSINGFDTDGDEVESVIDSAAAQGSWLMLSFHDLVGGEPDEATEFNDDEFEAIVDHVRALQKEGKVRVRTVGDAVKRYC